MAGYTRLKEKDPWYIFQVGDPDIAIKVREVNQYAPDIILQLNGKELEAALWGLENYKKNAGSSERDERIRACAQRNKLICKEFEKGMSRRNIAEKYQLSYSVVCRVVKKFRENKTLRERWATQR